MKSRYFYSRVSLAVLFFTSLFPASFSSAQTIKRNTGNLTAARQATVNGEIAISGLTLYEKSRIKTASLGNAIMNLGTKGRIELAGETDFTLLLAANSVGGDLQAGQAVFNVPANVLLRLQAAGCRIESDGKQPAVLGIEISPDRLVIATYRGTAEVILEGTAKSVLSGEEITVKLPSQNWKSQELANLTSGKTNKSNIYAPPATFLNLFFTSFANVLRRISRSYDDFSHFDTTLTCRDHDNLQCHKNETGLIP